MNKVLTITVTDEDNNSIYKANFRKNYKISRNDQTEFDGTILVNDVTRIVEQNSGNVPVHEPFDRNGKNYSFCYWLGTSGNNFAPADNTTLTAFYKASHYTNNAYSFASPGKRKFIKTPNGHLHLIYEDLGKVWYERSTDNGVTWTIANGGKPIDNLESCNPSIDYMDWGADNIFIVYERNNECKSEIVVRYLIDGISQFESTVIIDLWGRGYPDQAQQVVSCTSDKIIVVWQNGDGLYYRFGNLGATGGLHINWFNSAPIHIPNTDENSYCPTIAGKRTYSGNIYNDFHLAWQNVKEIRYAKLEGNPYTQTIQPVDYKVISSACGSRVNRYPCISLNNGDPVVSWTGDIPSVISTSVVTKKVNGNWIPPFKIGCLVDYTNNNSLSGSDGSAVAWYSSDIEKTRYATLMSAGAGVNYIGSVRNLPVTGDIQLTDGSAFSDIKAMVLNSSHAAPYDFNLLNYNFGSLSKENAADTLCYGRKAIIKVDDVEMIYHISNIKYNGQKIYFRDRNDTLLITSISALNNKLKTNVFTKSSSSSKKAVLTFDNFYYFVAKNGLPDTTRSKINYKISLGLFSNSSNNLISSYCIYRFTPTTVSDSLKSKLKNYSIDLTGLASGNYYLGIIVEYLNITPINQTNTQLNFADMIYEASVFGSSAPKENIGINYNENTVVTEYGLSQNYPNPFNPTTVITYQLPAAGFVTLTVYDALGKKMATLVNDRLEKGMYNVEFNGSNLSSGMYFYELRCGEYVSTKKMMLMK